MATTQEVLDHHLKSFGEGDLDGILSDYAEDAVLFTSHGTLKGLEAIKPLFETLIAEFSKPGVWIEMQTQSVEGDYAYIVWSAETPDNSYELGTDTFVIHDGRIVAQSFAGKIIPKA